MTVTTTTATNARRDLYRLIESVNADNDEVEITSKAGSAFLLSAAEFRSLRETAHLLRSPANARRIAEAAEAHARGEYTEHELIEVDDDLAPDE
jgi:antitoxin YefM